MKNTKNLFKINFATYILILTFLFTGLIKNILLIYLIVVFHELGHIFIIKLLKYPITKIEIYPMGGLTTIDKMLNTPLSHDLLISIFGLVFQIILFLIFKFLITNSLITYHTYNLFLIYNKTIFIFNLIPLIPLDGYQIFKTICELFLSFKMSFYLSLIISIISITLFITYNHLCSLNNYLIISFLIYALIKEIKDFKFKHLKFLIERYLYNFKYKKIKYHQNNNLNKLQKETYHYFKIDSNYLSEKKILRKKFNFK